jgi:hypothetical protein
LKKEIIGAFLAVPDLDLQAIHLKPLGGADVVV